MSVGTSAGGLRGAGGHATELRARTVGLVLDVVAVPGRRPHSGLPLRGAEGVHADALRATRLGGAVHEGEAGLDTGQGGVASGRVVVVVGEQSLGRRQRVPEARLSRTVV